MHLEKVIDSLNAPAAVVYKDPRGLYAITGGECPCRVMVTGNQGVLIDSLVSVREGYYRSLQFPLSFLIGDSTVTEIYARDIVHPSSNWQGQTPGRDTVVTIYRSLTGDAD